MVDGPLVAKAGVPTCPQLAANRSQFYYDLAAGPFYGYNRAGATPSQAVIWNWWRQGMMGGAKAHHDGIVAFSQTDFTEDLKKITVPVRGEIRRQRPGLSENRRGGSPLQLRNGAATSSGTRSGRPVRLSMIAQAFGP